MNRFNHAAKLIMVSSVILLLGLVGLELSFGNWFQPNRMNRLKIPHDYEGIRGVSHLYASDNATVIYRRDSFGLRGGYSDPQNIDILTLGGSAADQRYITEGKTWQDILSKELLKRGKSVSVVNAAVDGQTTFGHIKNFHWWFPLIPDLKATYVLLYVGINDIHSVTKGTHFHLLVEDSSSLRTRVETIVRENSALYLLARTLKGMYLTSVNDLGHRRKDFTRWEWTRTPNLKIAIVPFNFTC